MGQAIYFYRVKTMGQAIYFYRVKTMGQAIYFSPLNPLRLRVLSEAGVRN